MPFNHTGPGLAVLPALGLQFDNVNAQAVILGTTAVISIFGYEFDP